MAEQTNQDNKLEDNKEPKNPEVVIIPEINSITGSIMGPVFENQTTVVVQENFGEKDSNNSETNKYKILDEVYNYQNKSKLDRLPKWSKILISCLLIILAIGVIIGGAFAIKAVNDRNIANQPTPPDSATSAEVKNLIIEESQPLIDSFRSWLS